MPTRRLLIIVFSLLCGSSALALEKWIYCQRNLQVEKGVGELDELMRRGKAAGYTHLLLADSKLAKLGDVPGHYFRHTARVQELAKQHGIQIVPAIFHIGYSNSMLWHDPNLIEGMPVKAAPLVVENGGARSTGEQIELPGGDFSDLKRWSWKDETVAAEEGAARVTDPNGQLARIVQKLKVQPWRQYHVTVRVKTEDFKGKPEIKAIPSTGGVLNWDSLKVQPTQDWTTHHVIFNSQGNTEVQLYFGVWDGRTGSLWWDDAEVREVAFVNLLRRHGAPLKITTSDRRILVEGEDFEPLKDPLMGAKPWAGEYDVYHEPPQLKLKKPLPNGTKLQANYYHAVTIYDGQAMICPSEPKTYELLRDEMQRVHKLWGAKAYMMSHDEVRVMNWCESCQSRKLTPGQQLADNVKRCIEIARDIAPEARLYTWSDMFDPHHNAQKEKFYLVNGDLTGSWEGLTKDVRIMPWYFSKRAESLKFFAERGHPQVIAGYYDEKPERIKEWLTAAKAAGAQIEGVMYTTWQNKYVDLEAFSKAADEAK